MARCLKNNVFVVPEEPIALQVLFLLSETSCRERRSNHCVCSVWTLPSAETITCVVPNVFVTLEVLFTERMRFGASRGRSQANAESTGFIERKIGRPPQATPPPTLTVAGISTSALECLVL